MTPPELPPLPSFEEAPQPDADHGDLMYLMGYSDAQRDADEAHARGYREGFLVGRARGRRDLGPWGTDDDNC